MIAHYYYKFPKPNHNLLCKLHSKFVSVRMVTGFISPSGRISIGVVPAPKKLKPDVDYDAQVPEQLYYERSRWDAFEGLIHEARVVQLDPPSLGLSAVANHHRPAPRRYGLKGISANGRNKVYEGAKLLERKYGRRLGFYTLTCPYIDSSLIYEFNRNIGEIVRRWFQELRRMYEAKACNFRYVAVIEIQSKRFEETGIPVLHIHYIANCYCGHGREWVLNADEIRYLWMRTVAQVCGVEVDTSSSVDAQVVKKSASGYLAKYISKGSGVVEFLADIAPSQLPRQWWSMSASIRDGLKKLTVQIPQSIAEWYFSGNGRDPDEFLGCSYSRDVCVNWKGQDLRVGISAQLSKQWLHHFIEPSRWLEVMFSL